DYTLCTRPDTTVALARATVTRGADGRLTAAAGQLRSAELGAVTGTVAGQGAGVMVYLAGTSFLALTDAEGDFAITRVPAGDYQAVARLNGSHTPAPPGPFKAGDAPPAAAAPRPPPALPARAPHH